MTTRPALWIAVAGSGLLLLGAFAFQHIGGMPPCKMCIWQRYPHGVAVLVGVVALIFHQRVFLFCGTIAAATTSMIGFYHAGVERGWWEGPTTCSSGPIRDLSADALLDQILSAPLVRCDEIPWELFGISMAGWNGVISLGLAFCWVFALRTS